VRTAPRESKSDVTAGTSAGVRRLASPSVVCCTEQPCRRSANSFARGVTDSSSRPRVRRSRTIRRSGACASACSRRRPRSELGSPQGGAGAPDERDRGHDLHPGRRAQPAGALAGAHPGGRVKDLPGVRYHVIGARSTRSAWRVASRVVRNTAPRGRSSRTDAMPRRREIPSANCCRIPCTATRWSPSSSTP